MGLPTQAYVVTGELFMKPLRYLFFVLALIFTSSAFAVPSVTEIEDLIAAGDYAKAKQQLGVVLKQNPDSYVANRYMLEIITIENARDNVSSVQYKLFENRIKAIEEKVAQERQDRVASKFWQGLKVFILVVVIGIFGALAYRKIKAMQKLKAEREELEAWVSSARADLLDISQHATTISLRIAKNYNDIDELRSLKEMTDNCVDAMDQLNQNDYNRAAISAHIRDSKSYLYRRCGVDI